MVTLRNGSEEDGDVRSECEEDDGTDWYRWIECDTDWYRWIECDTDWYRWIECDTDWYRWIECDTLCAVCVGN